MWQNRYFSKGWCVHWNSVDPVLEFRLSVQKMNTTVKTEESETSYIECELPPSSGNHKNTRQWRNWNLLLLHSSSNHVQAHFCRWWNIRQKTLLITTHMEIDNITCSNAVINWLKGRNNCLCNSNRWKQACWFRDSSWLEKRSTGAEEYVPCDINSDKTGLFLNQQPSKVILFMMEQYQNSRLQCSMHAVPMVAENYHHL